MSVHINYFVAYLYLHIRWWMKTHISSLAKFIPGHIRGPLPNPKKLNGFGGIWNTRFYLQAIPKTTRTWWCKLELTSNLDGSNLSGSGKTTVSWWMETTSRLTDQPFLIPYPEIFKSFSVHHVVTSLGKMIYFSHLQLRNHAELSLKTMV